MVERACMVRISGGVGQTGCQHPSSLYTRSTASWMRCLGSESKCQAFETETFSQNAKRAAVLRWWASCVTQSNCESGLKPGNLNHWIGNFSASARGYAAIKGGKYQARVRHGICHASVLDTPMTPQAALPPAFPVLRLSSFPPLPRSSVPL